MSAAGSKVTVAIDDLADIAPGGFTKLHVPALDETFAVMRLEDFELVLSRAGFEACTRGEGPRIDLSRFMKAKP